MGIDIYARWPGQTEAETDAQGTGYSIAHGHIGYLREAYHGEPYATRVLVPEAFDRVAHPSGAPIPAATLRNGFPRRSQPPRAASSSSTRKGRTMTRRTSS